MAAIGTLPVLFATGVHGSRPAASAVGKGGLYSCTTHGLLYQTDGSSWTTWATLGATASGSITASGYTQSTAKMLGRSTASTGAIEEITVGSGLTLSAGSLSASGGSGAGTILAIKTYGPTGAATVYGTSSTAMADVDSTNLAVTFTAPASTNVLVRLSSFADCVSTGEGYWGLREASSNLAGTMGNVIRASTPGGQAFICYTLYLAGISAGSHTYKWAFASDTATANRHRIIMGGGEAVTKFNPAIMEVISAP